MPPKKAGKLDSHPRTRTIEAPPVEPPTRPAPEETIVNDEVVITPPVKRFVLSVTVKQPLPLSRLSEGELFFLDAEYYKAGRQQVYGIDVTMVRQSATGELLYGEPLTFGYNTLVQRVEIT